MKQLDKKLIIDNWFWKVFQTFFETNGKKWNVLTMEKSKNTEAVFILPLTKNNEIIYLKEFKFWPNEYQFVIPAWWVENKSLEETAKDELLEETWYIAEEIIYIWKYNHNNYISWKIHLFIWINCDKIWWQNLKDIEEIEVLKSSIEDFENMIKNNEIHCPWSEIAFRKAKELTNNFKNKS